MTLVDLNVRTRESTIVMDKGVTSIARGIYPLISQSSVWLPSHDVGCNQCLF